MTTTAAKPAEKRGSASGLPNRTLRVSCERGKARVQAGIVRGAGPRKCPRHRAGFDAQAGGKVRGETGRRAADAVPAHSAEHDPRLLPPTEGPSPVDYVVVGAFAGPGRRGQRSARNSGNGARL